MNPLRTIVLLLVALLQGLPAQALRPVTIGRSAVCEMVCCADLAEEGLEACECAAGGGAPASEVPALPAALRDSEQGVASLGGDGIVLRRIPQRRGEEAQPVSVTRCRPHRPGVRLTVLFCTFLN